LALVERQKLCRGGIPGTGVHGLVTGWDMAQSAEKIVTPQSGVTRNPHDCEKRICATVASVGRGVGTLLEHIFSLEIQYRRDGRLQERRTRAFELETLDWAMEMVKADLQEKLRTAKFTSTEPREAAIELIGKITDK
jgi:putative protein kinase ArgK-like GTPase of G3E family